MPERLELDWICQHFISCLIENVPPLFGEPSPILEFSVVPFTQFGRFAMLRMIKCFMGSPVECHSVLSVLGNDYVRGLTVRESRGWGIQDEKTNKFSFNTRTEIDIILSEGDVEKAIARLESLARQEQVKLGKIFVIPVEDAVRIETGDRGVKAVR